MPRKLSNSLPANQTIDFHNKTLWEFLRIMAGNNNISISQLVECAVEDFLISPERDKKITRMKLMKELDK